MNAGTCACVRVHLKRSAQVRVAELGLSHFERRAQFVEQRAMRMPERVPVDERQAGARTSRTQVAFAQIIRSERRSLPRCENQPFG